MEDRLKNKLIITNEDNYIISSKFQDGEMTEIDLYPLNEEESILGNIYVCKVKNIVKNINAAFVEIADNKVCYLSLDEGIEPLFTSNNSKNGNINVGDELLVQVSKEQIKTKAPVVTTKLNLTGKYVVLVHGKEFVGISSKISENIKRQELNKLLKSCINGDYGFIARTNAALVDEDRISQEIDMLIRKYEEIKKFGIYRTRFSNVYETPPGYIGDIRDSFDRNLSEIITDNRIIYDKIDHYINEYQSEDIKKLRFYEDKQISLSNLFGIKSKLNHLLNEKVWLKSGASIIIQHTEALTAIDVNSGKAIKTNKKNPEKHYFKINMEAAKEIAKQIRLRNISGIIIIDFIDMKQEEHKEDLMNKLKELFTMDQVKTVLIDMTPLNLVEVTRKKIRKPLHEKVAIINKLKK